jgi:hypothetical protein
MTSDPESPDCPHCDSNATLIPVHDGSVYYVCTCCAKTCRVIDGCVERQTPAPFSDSQGNPMFDP